MLLEKDHIEIPKLSLEYQALKSLEQLQEWVILLSHGPYRPHELRQPLHAFADRYNAQHIHPLIDAAFYIDEEAQRGLPNEAIEAFSACERLFIGQELMDGNPYIASLRGGAMLSLIDQDKERVQTMRRLVIKENGKLKVADLWSDIVTYHNLDELEDLQKYSINACEVTRAKNLISFINENKYEYPSRTFVIRGWIPIHEAKIGQIPDYSSFKKIPIKLVAAD